MKKSLFVLAILAASCLAIAQPVSQTPNEVLTVAIKASDDSSLQGAYWKCMGISDATENRGKGSIAFPDNDLAGCTITSREVQDRYFGGDFGKLHNWTKANRDKAKKQVLVRK